MAEFLINWALEDSADPKDRPFLFRKGCCSFPTKNTIPGGARSEMKARDNDELVAKVHEAGGEYSLYEILDYAQRSEVSTGVLKKMSGAEIVKMIEKYLDYVYGLRLG